LACVAGFAFAGLALVVAPALIANCPRPIFWNRASAPFVPISRMIAAYSVECGVAPPGLVQ